MIRLDRLWPRLTPRTLRLALIAVPLGLAALYYAILAQDRYVSTAVLTVRHANQEARGSAGLASLLIAGVSSASLEDTRLLHDYMRSEGLMERLDQRLKLRAHYEAPWRDPIYRLWPGTSREWMISYWRARLEISLDEISGLLTVRVQGFDADFARQVNAALLEESESFVNGISHRIAQEQMRFAQGELDRAAERLHTARTALLDFQGTHGMIDPGAQAQATGVLAAELRTQLARVEAELGTKQSYLNGDTPDILTLKAQAEALRQQIQRETREVTATGPAGRQALNRLASDFRDLKARNALAEEAYRSAQVSVEATRVEASRKVKSLVVIEAPTRPETAEYPRRLYDLSTALLVCALLYGIARLAVATINEHRD